MKINWKRVFLGGLLAGIIILILSSATTQLLFKVKKPMLESFGHTIPTEFTIGDIMFGISISLVMGIIAVWLYSAIRPRFGSGPKTALIAGLFCYKLMKLIIVFLIRHIRSVSEDQPSYRHLYRVLTETIHKYVLV